MFQTLNDNWITIRVTDGLRSTGCTAVLGGIGGIRCRPCRSFIVVVERASVGSQAPGTVSPRRRCEPMLIGLTWAVDGTVFEMWLNLPGSQKSVTEQS